MQRAQLLSKHLQHKVCYISDPILHGNQAYEYHNNWQSINLTIQENTTGRVKRSEGCVHKCVGAGGGGGGGGGRVQYLCNSHSESTYAGTPH